MKYIASVLLLCGLVACGGGRSTSAAASPNDAASTDAAAIPDCGAVKAVWVNTKKKVYHEPGDPYYGKTKHGKYMCPSEAKKEGDRPAGGAKAHNSSM